MDIGAADGGGCNPDQRVERTDIGNRLLAENDLAGFDENGGFHMVFHWGAPSQSWFREPNVKPAIAAVSTQLRVVA